MPFNIDSLPENADWTKRTWDLPTDKAEFLAFLECSGRTIEEFKKLPVFKFALATGSPRWLRDL